MSWAIHKVHVWLTSVLHTARISNVEIITWVINKKMVNLKLSEEMRNDVINTSQGWDKEKIWVPDKNWWSSAPWSDALTTELTHGQLGHIQGSHVTRVLSTARISNVEILICMMYVCMTGVRKVIGSIPVRDSVPCSWHVDYIISHFFTELKIYHFSFSIMPLEQLLRNLDNGSENWGLRLESDCYKKLHVRY